jgi:hypothetical protein
MVQVRYREASSQQEQIKHRPCSLNQPRQARRHRQSTATRQPPTKSTRTSAGSPNSGCVVQKSLYRLRLFMAVRPVRMSANIRICVCECLGVLVAIEPSVFSFRIGSQAAPSSAQWPMPRQPSGRRGNAFDCGLRRDRDPGSRAPGEDRFVAGVVDFERAARVIAAVVPPFQPQSQEDPDAFRAHRAGRL